ncbi:uncharacterized protein PAC_01203 [Phialocephala subalpina]|uniref:Dienelactone hydrolase domain-containing protein n=1 Tax=Phialocephala subalpina TaxID=576137 RepID=A0A1L7WF10_9HELO|nr:uncharacterized protein PAC_01203 [Phialocephala subalpina]
MADIPNEQCCTIPPFKSDYKPVGRTITLQVPGGEDLPVYVTGSEGAKIALVGIYDIFGVHPNTQQGADHLAQQCGFQVLLPDFFRGKGWDMNDMPPKEGREKMQAYIQSIGSWEIVGPDLLATVEHLKRQGVESIGAYGFCFGGKKLAQAAASPAHSTLFNAVALVHPTNLSPSDGDLFTVPVALIPSGGEDQTVMNAIWEKLQEKEIAGKCVRKDFLEGHHGFASSRSDWNNPKLAGMARDAYEVMRGFFAANL